MAAFLLPPELIAYIGGFLSVRDFLRLRRTCRLVNRVASTKQVTGEELQLILDRILEYDRKRPFDPYEVYGKYHRFILKQFAITRSELLKVRFASLLMTSAYEWLNVYLDQRVPTAKEVDRDIFHYYSCKPYGCLIYGVMDDIVGAFELLERLLKLWGIPNDPEGANFVWIDYDTMDGQLLSVCWDAEHPKLCRLFLQYDNDVWHLPHYDEIKIWAYSH